LIIESNNPTAKTIHTATGKTTMIRIVTDSTADVPLEIAAKYQIAVIPCFINFGQETLRDGLDISRERFYQRLIDARPLPTTSAPNIENFVMVYRQLAAEGADAIISIHLGGQLSGTVSIASIAAREVEDLVKVSIFDSGQLTLGVGTQAIAAAEAAQAGESVESILAMLRGKADRTFIFASLETLDYLERSGRLSHLKFRFGALLDIKPIIRLHKGIIDMEMVRTRSRSVKQMIQHAANLGNLESLDFVHTNAGERLTQVAEMAKDLIPKLYSPLISNVTSAIGTHIGPGAVGLICVQASSG
jgi:DegV family protein with EDD domain